MAEPVEDALAGHSQIALLLAVLKARGHRKSPRISIKCSGESGRRVAIHSRSASTSIHNLVLGAEVLCGYLQFHFCVGFSVGGCSHSLPKGSQVETFVSRDPKVEPLALRVLEALYDTTAGTAIQAEVGKQLVVGIKGILETETISPGSGVYFLHFTRRFVSKCSTNDKQQ